MPGIKSFYHHLVWLFKGKQVFGLVGKAGTGKSFRAQLVAKKQNINLIIDDGLLIKDQQIIAGKSAKQASGAYSAIKTALFDSPMHRNEVRLVLKKESFKRILILGTSIRMIHKIAKLLHLPHPGRIINIEEIATEEEIARAKHSRHNENKHIIPVPAVEVKRKHSHIFFDSVKIFFRKRFNIFGKTEVFEKSVVQPLYSSKGKVTISEQALSQMILHCVCEFNSYIDVKKITIIQDKHQYIIDLSLNIDFGTQISGLIHNLQKYILENLEKYAGLMLKTVNITIDSIS